MPSADTTREQVEGKLAQYRALFAQGRQAAFVVRKGALDYKGSPIPPNPHPMGREEAIGLILEAAGEAAGFTMFPSPLFWRYTTGVLPVAR